MNTDECLRDDCGWQTCDWRWGSCCCAMLTILWAGAERRGPLRRGGPAANRSAATGRSWGRYYPGPDQNSNLIALLESTQAMLQCTTTTTGRQRCRLTHSGYTRSFHSMLIMRIPLAARLSPLKSWFFICRFYHSKNMNQVLKFWHRMHNSKTHWTMSKSFRYLEAFSCKLKKLKKFPGNEVFL